MSRSRCENPRQGLHHLLLELYSLDDVGQGYDVTGSRCRSAGITMTTWRRSTCKRHRTSSSSMVGVGATSMSQDRGR